MSADPMADAHAEAHPVRRARQVRQLLRAPRGSVDLTTIDPRATPGLPRKSVKGIDAKAWSRAEVARLGLMLAGHQERLYAAATAGTDRRRVLLVLQAMDCGGKDGTVRSVVGALNPQGVQITAFGPPTPEELAHDYLWRVHRVTPGAGYVGVFNRSHYEDVLAVRVRNLARRKVWRARYDQINAFEHILAADGVTLIKVMLHISYEEQAERLLARLADPTKRWKFNPGDLADRSRWDDYQAAYSEVLSRCGTNRNPWYVVPADRKWYRNWAVANLLLAHLDGMRLTYPEATVDVPSLQRQLESDKGPSSPAGGEQ
jgi:PPK2 family polyphosphate:nucleotide phosphotransferase